MTTIQCEACGASFRGESTSCEFCGAARPAPASTTLDPARPQEFQSALGAAQDAIPRPFPGFWWLHGGIFILVGLFFTATIIGAIVGIPAIFIGVNSWRRGLAARR